MKKINTLFLLQLLLSAFFCKLGAAPLFTGEYAETYGAKIIQEALQTYESKDSVPMKVLNVVEKELGTNLYHEYSSSPTVIQRIANIRANWEELYNKDTEVEKKISTLESEIFNICNSYSTIAPFDEAGKVLFSKIQQALFSSQLLTDQQKLHLEEYKKYKNFFPSLISQNCGSELLDEMDRVSYMITSAKTFFTNRVIPGDYGWKDVFAICFVLDNEHLTRLKDLALKDKNVLLLEVLESVQLDLAYSYAKKINYRDTYERITKLVNTDLPDSCVLNLKKIKSLMDKRAQMKFKNSAMRETGESMSRHLSP